jgi:hypothetical protein
LHPGIFQQPANHGFFHTLCGLAVLIWMGRGFEFHEHEEDRLA